MAHDLGSFTYQPWQGLIDLRERIAQVQDKLLAQALADPRFDEVTREVTEVLSRLDQTPVFRLRREPEQRTRTFPLSRAEEAHRQADMADDASLRRLAEAQRDAQAAETAARVISDYLNHGGNPRSLAEWFSRKEHRTLQQRFMEVVMAFIHDEARLAEAGSFDLRNQATGALAQHLIDSLGDEVQAALHLPHI
jgi:hypothetical protein